MDAGPVWIYAAALAAVWLGYALRRAHRHRRSRGILQAAVRDGLTEPPSLHPVIDAARCLGCGTCVTACPEGDVLGMIDGRAQLIEPTRCIGHGACREACPTDAISLVFGTATRGVDIPLVGADFSTNVPGIFIAGELGGMGLIRNAVEQGRQAIESIRRLAGSGGGDVLDVVIVGAGPAGLAASLAAMEHRLRFVTVEQDTLGGCIAHYPRGKIVMTAPARLPIVGPVGFSETTKEELLEFWREVENRTGLEIRYDERLESIHAANGSFEVCTSRSSYAARSVLLAIGRRGTPRKLEVPGEDLPKVVYRLNDAAEYRHRRVLVVGGGDSALEAAASLAAEEGTEVTLSYRASAFTRARQANRARVEAAKAAGRLRVMLESNVQEITEEAVVIEHEGQTLTLDNDSVIICVGGVLPTAFLESIGVAVETKFGAVNAPPVCPTTERLV